MLEIEKGMDKYFGGRPAGRGEIRPSFVIVLWLEPQKASMKPEWRWRVTCVQTGERAYFHRLTDVFAFVSHKARVPPPC